MPAAMAARHSFGEAETANGDFSSDGKGTYGLSALRRTPQAS
jgi:hypothetical protein